MAKRLQLREALKMPKRGEIGGSSPGEKCRSNTRCPKCDLVFVEGVWKHMPAGNGEGQQWKLCPACIQVKNRMIGGIVQCSGTFTGSHRQELLNRIRNVERHTNEERPLERIINLKEDKDGIVVSATSEHLAARIGKSIQRDFHGNLDLRYAQDDKFAYVHWHRDEKQ